MEKESILKDRMRSLLDHYGIGVKELVEKIGGSRATYFNILNGTSQPDFKTTAAILNGFPDMSAEWFTRGLGPMLRTDILSREEAESLIAENKAIKAMYRAELMGKHKGAALLSPDTRERNLRELQFDDHKKSLKGKSTTSKSVSGRVQGSSILQTLELFKP